MTNYNTHYTDLVIIGAGPAGLFASFQAASLDMKSIIVDSLEQIGGQCSSLYPEKPIYDIPAYENITGNDLTNNLKEQIDKFVKKDMIDFLLSNSVENIEDQNNKDSSFNFIISTDKNNKIFCKAVIIAAGAGAFIPNKPPLADICHYEDKSIFYLISKKDKFKDKIVMIAGGGDSAVDWAIELYDIAKKIYVIHRRNKFRCHDASYNKLIELSNSDKLDLIIPYHLDEIIGNKNTGIIDEIIVKDLQSNKKSFKIDNLIALYGMANDISLLKNFGIEFENKLIKVNPLTMETSRSKIYAIGDIINYPNKLKLILTGFSEAAIAANQLYSIIHNGKKYHFEYSTSKFAQK